MYLSPMHTNVAEIEQAEHCFHSTDEHIEYSLPIGTRESR